MKLFLVFVWFLFFIVDIGGGGKRDVYFYGIVGEIIFVGV